MVFFQAIIYIFSFILDNAKKDFNIPNIILVQDFCPLKTEIARSPIEFHLNCGFSNICGFQNS